MECLAPAPPAIEAGKGRQRQGARPWLRSPLPRFSSSTCWRCIGFEASICPRDHLWRRTIAPRSSRPTTWNAFLPMLGVIGPHARDIRSMTALPSAAVSLSSQLTIVRPRSCSHFHLIEQPSGAPAGSILSRSRRLASSPRIAHAWLPASLGERWMSREIAHSSRFILISCVLSRVAASRRRRSCRCESIRHS